MPSLNFYVDVKKEYFEEIREKNSKMLEQDGEICDLYIRKTSGVRCDCWDDRRKQADARCEICFGTGWVGGYDKQSSITFMFPKTARTLVWAEFGLHITLPYRIWTMDTEIHNKDFIHRQRDGFRFIMTNTQESRWRDILMHNEAEVEVVTNPGDIVYKVQKEFDTISLQSPYSIMKYV